MNTDFFGGVIVGILVGAAMVAFIAGSVFQGINLLPYKDGQVCVVDVNVRVIECFRDTGKGL